MSLLDNLVSYWKLDEASGTRVDSHGSNDLTDNNTVGSTTGKIGNAASFVAANAEYLSHTNNTDFTTGDVSFFFAGWFNATTLTNFPVIIRNGNTGTRDFALFYNTLGLVNALEWQVIKPDGTQIFTRAALLSTGTDYFFVVYHDATNDEIGLSLNGGAFATASISGGLATAVGEFQVGGSSDQSIWWNGWIDEVGYWKGRIPAAGEVARLYNSGNGLSYDNFVAPTIARVVEPPAVDAVWQQYLEAQSAPLATSIYLPVPPPPPPPPVTPAPTINPVQPPPIDAAWQEYMESWVHGMRPLKADPLPTLPPTPLPQAGTAGKALLPKDPQADVVTRNFVNRTADMLNSLMTQGRLVQVDGQARKWSLTSGFTALRPPTATDDITTGALPGMTWVNTSASTVYICAGNTRGAAVWLKLATA